MFRVEKLQEYCALATEWFKINEMKINAEKCLSFISGNKFEQMWARVTDDITWENRTVKLLGITIGNELKFDERLTNICILVYNDYESTFDDLLTKDGSVTVHHSNIQTLAIKLYKVHNNISQTIFGDLFKRENNGYYLLWKSNFVIPQIRTGLKRSNSVRYFGRIIWNLILEELKNMTSLNIFKKKKKKKKNLMMVN